MSSDATDDPRPEAGSLLSRISTEMVRAQKQFFGKGPTHAKSYMLDDMLVVVMRDGLTAAEQTMLDFGHPDLVRQFRQIFQNAVTERLSGLIEDLTGRKVLTYQSQVLFAPDLVCELFVFDSDDTRGEAEATAEGQLTDREVGAVEDGDAMESPSTGSDQ